MKKKNDVKKNVWWLSWTSFFNDASSEMIFPILPLFMANVLGLNKSLIGLVEGIAKSTSSILEVVSGYVSDKIKRRKPLVVAGYSLSAISKPLFSIASTLGHVITFRILDRFGKGIRDSPRDALISHSAVKKGHSFGLQRMLDTSGAVVGVILTILLLKFVTENYRTIFGLAIIPAIIAVAILTFFVKEVKPKKSKKKYSFESTLKELPCTYKVFLFSAILFALANFSYAFYILKVESIGVKLAFIPAVYLVYNIVYAAFAMPMGNLSDKIGRKNIIFWGYLIFAGVALIFAHTNVTWLAWILFGFYGLQIAMVNGVSRAFVSDLAPKGKEGTAFGIYHTSIGLAALPASIIAGVLWDYFGSSATFMYAATLAILAALVLLFIKEKK